METMQKEQLGLQKQKKIAYQGDVVKSISKVQVKYEQLRH